MWSNKDLSAVQLVVVLTLLVIFAGVCGSAAGGSISCNAYQDGASGAARSWANSHGLPSNSNVTCVNRDSDGDGYVSCTVGIPGDTPVLIPLECQVWVLIGESSCRM